MSTVVKSESSSLLSHPTQVTSTIPQTIIPSFSEKIQASKVILKEASLTNDRH